MVYFYTQLYLVYVLRIRKSSESEEKRIQRKIQEQTELVQSYCVGVIFCSSENLDPVKRGKLLYPPIPGKGIENKKIF